MWFLALKHLFSRPRQTLVTLGGVSLGVGAFCTFASMMTGFQEYIVDQLINNDSHVRISIRDDVLQEHELDNTYYPKADHVFWLSPPSGLKNTYRIENPLGWQERLDKDPRILAYSPQLQAQAMFTRGPISMAGRIIGSDPFRQIRITNIVQYMTAGDFLQISYGGHKIVLGDGLLKKIGGRVGENIIVSTGTNKGVPFKVVGTFHFGIINLDDSIAFSSLADAQSVNQTPSQISDIALRLTNVSMAGEVASQYAELSVDKVQSWDQANAHILSVFSLQDFIRSFISASIMVVAAFGIYNVLSILVNQKRRDIGILRSVGFDRHDIVRLFLIQGLMLGASGALIGIGIGFIMALYLQTLKIAGMTDHLTISFSPKIYLSGMLVALIASALSSIFPARSAGKLRPIDIVRSGE